MSEKKITQTKLNLIPISVNRRLRRLFQAMTNKKIIPNLEIVYKWLYKTGTISFKQEMFSAKNVEVKNISRL